jgi:hypothetical protein
VNIRKHLGAPALVVVLAALPAQAQDMASPYEEADAEALAIVHFEQGVAFFEKQLFEAALAEFIASHELKGNWAILYNIGVCYHRIGRYEDALRVLTDYLEQGGAWVGPERKKFVDDLIEEMKSVSGTLVIDHPDPGVTVVLDGRKTLVTPVVGPLVVDAGLHQLAMSAPGYEPVTVEVSVAAGQSVAVPVELTPTPAMQHWLELREHGTLASNLKYSAAGLWAGAGLALVAAAITGAMAIGAESDQDQAILDCWPNTGPDHCPRAHDLGEKGRTLMWATNGLFIAAGTMALTGLVLWLVWKLKFARPPAGAHPWLLVGPVGGAGSFGVALAVGSWAG